LDGRFYLLLKCSPEAAVIVQRAFLTGAQLAPQLTHGPVQVFRQAKHLVDVWRNRASGRRETTGGGTERFASAASRVTLTGARA
jgi:hypothetical protein